MHDWKPEEKVMGIIELKNIVKTFPSEKVGEGVHAVRDVSLTIEE